ncbi:hypothetical protein EC5412_5474, partial [Escherichia coli 5412]
MEQEAVINKA